MTRISAADFSEMSPAQLRLAEANHLFHPFKESRNAEPNYGMFLLTTYFDALLFCFVSIHEMVDSSHKEKLRSLDSFVFFKALRNIATHHSVLSGIKGRFERPIARIVSVSIGGTVPFSEQLFLVPEKLEAIFTSILVERPGERRTIEVARRHLAALKKSAGDIMLVDVIEAAITEATPHVA